MRFLWNITMERWNSTQTRIINYYLGCFGCSFKHSEASCGFMSESQAGMSLSLSTFTSWQLPCSLFLMGFFHEFHDKLHYTHALMGSQNFIHITQKNCVGTHDVTNNSSHHFLLITLLISLYNEQLIWSAMNRCEVCNFSSSQERVKVSSSF